jgi:hypothetical protein
MILLLSSFAATIGYFSSAEGSEAQVVNTSEGLSAASGSNRFVVWIDSTPGNQDILFRRSMDSGITWQTTKNLSSNPGESTIPEIAVSGSNVYVIWLQYNPEKSRSDIFFRRSTDNGATWGAKINISSNGEVGSSTAHLTAFGSNVYIVWDDGDATDVYFRRSADNGATWKPVFKITNTPGPSYGPQIAASGSNVYVLWSQKSGGGGSPEIFFRRSTDSGATWNGKVNLSNNPGRSDYSEIAVSGSNIYVVWHQLNALGTMADIFLRRSTDSGATWKSVVSITSSGSVDESSTPQVISSSNNVYVVWEQGHNVGNFEIYFRRSANNGATWKPIFNLSNNPGHSSAEQVAVSGSNVYVLWEQHDAGGNLRDIFFRGSVDSGATWQTFKNLSQNGHSRGPQVVVSGSVAYSVWIDQVINDVDISFRRSTDNGASWKAVQDLSNNSGASFDPRIGA